ncbi:MAG: Holliday junction branch migration protein RuvA, partial [Alphaproteobacteria bacterium]
PAVIALSGAVEARTAPQPVADAISALVNLGYAPVQASAAIAEALKNAGEGAEAKTLIRLGLRELAR